MLQGSLENFALDEVLGLLAGTSKTGHLEIAGNRGTGKLAFLEGRLVDGNASYMANGTDLEDVMFELLRYDDGTFSFVGGDVSPSDGVENVATVLASAENRLRDWRSIESVVPSLKHQVIPAPELPTDEVTVSKTEWAALMVIASGCPVSLVCDKLDLGEVEGSRQIKNLAERKLVSVSEPIGGYAAASAGTQSVSTPPPPPAPMATESTVPPPPPVGFGTSEVAEPSSILDPLGSVDGPLSAADVMALSPSAESFSTDLPPESDLFDTEDRPPMPPAPVADELDSAIANGLVPPAPPSPAEISSFGDSIEDASELEDEDDEGKGGGLLARYLKSDD